MCNIKVIRAFMFTAETMMVYQQCFAHARGFIHCFIGLK